MEKQAHLQQILDALAEHIRTRRKEMGLTQEQLAEKAELSTNYIARLELGTSTPSLAALICLSRTLGIPISDLLAIGMPFKWQDQAQEVAFALEYMDDSHARFVLDQMRAIIGFVESFSEKGEATE